MFDPVKHVPTFWPFLKWLIYFIFPEFSRLPFFKEKIEDLSIYLNGRISERTEISHLLFTLQWPQALWQGQDKAIQVYWVHGRGASTWTVFWWFPGTLVGIWIGIRTAGTWASTHMGHTFVHTWILIICLNFWVFILNALHITFLKSWQSFSHAIARDLWTMFGGKNYPIVYLTLILFFLIIT